MPGQVSSDVRFYGPVVCKDGDRHPLERDLLRNRVFVPGRWWGSTYIMPRGWPAQVSDLQQGVALLATGVWPKVPATINYGWRKGLTQHIKRCYPSPRLLERIAALQPLLHHTIHGDATLANLVRLPLLGVRWIDPLYRPYIPGDPLVDVGKVLQSCWNYEGVLQGEDARLLDDFHHFMPLDDFHAEQAVTWMLVHFARLLRYHQPAVRNKFKEVMSDVYRCSM